jgi:hypothetical protein
MKRILTTALLVVALCGCGPSGSQLAAEATKAVKSDLPVQRITATDDGRVTVTLSIPRGFMGNGASERCSDMADSIMSKVDGVKDVRVLDLNGEAVGEYQKK